MILLAKVIWQECLHSNLEQDHIHINIRVSGC